MRNLRIVRPDGSPYEAPTEPQEPPVAPSTLDHLAAALWALEGRLTALKAEPRETRNTFEQADLVQYRQELRDLMRNLRHWGWS